MIEYHRIGFNTERHVVRRDLLRAHRAARRTRLRRSDDPARDDDQSIPRALLARAPSRCRDRRYLLALRRRDVDRRVRDCLPPLGPVMRNPLPERGRCVPVRLGDDRLLRPDRDRLADRPPGRPDRVHRPDRGRRLVGASQAARRFLADPPDAGREPAGREAHSRRRERDGRRPRVAEHDPRAFRGRACARARGLPGAELADPPLGLGRGRRARGGAGPARDEPHLDAQRRPRRERRDRRRRPDPGDRGRRAHVPARRADRVDAPTRAVALARAWRRREGAHAVRRPAHPRDRRPRRRRDRATSIEV